MNAITWSTLILVFLRTLTFVKGLRCSFPAEWHGTWLENGLGEIVINKHVISRKGRCTSSQGKKYLLLDREQECFKCLVFTPQHENILQYKESYCDKLDDLESVCSDITHDFRLHTIVKVSGTPVPCPFQGHHTFTYTNGSVESCKEKPSEIHACADNSRFIFDYKRCDVNSRISDNQLGFQCMAVWANGQNYLYGRFKDRTRHSRQKMFRCFMYSMYGTRVEMSMSTDATCQDLISPRHGMYTFDLGQREEKWPRPSCVFPEWLSPGRVWRDAPGRWRMTVGGLNDEITLHDLMHPDFVVPEEDSSEARLRSRCYEVKSDVPSYLNKALRVVHVLAHVTNDSCVSSFRCLRFEQKADQVFELRIGSVSDDTYLACQDAYFTSSSINVFFPHELAAGVLTSCPLAGSYSYGQRLGDCSGVLNVGCEEKDLMVFNAVCPTRLHAVEIMQCYQSWQHGSKHYVIAGRAGEIYDPVACLVFDISDSEWSLTESLECGSSDSLRIMDRIINFTISSPLRGSCSRKIQLSTGRSHGYAHVTRKPDIRENGVSTLVRSPSKVYRSNEVLERPLIELNSRIQVINNSDTRTCASIFLSVCALLTITLNR